MSSTTSSSTDTSAQGHGVTPTSGAGVPKPVASNPPSAQFTNGLLVASGTAFLAGIFGSLWNQSRQEKRMGVNRAVAGSSVGPSLQSLNDLKKAESLLKEGRMLGAKAFAVATTLCLSGAVLVVGGTRWALEVETIPEFSAKMRELFPKQKTKFVDAVVSTDRSVFGGSVSGSSSEPLVALGKALEEKDLDHEEDRNILGRIEQELRRLEAEEETLVSQQSSTTSSAPTST
ncbi:hypothetical protein EDD21DRAFT_363668 [Dissophora ornata]|nr:hypothetical protein BGZ58_005990 [Dissophora ornata]KAI8605404.1 hypothetical protein EDD21DRAFT_363668 [Dissophora ornata]